MGGAAGSEPARRGEAVRLPAGVVADLTEGFLRGAATRPWQRFGSFDWDLARPDELTPGHLAALSFVTAVEDHLPGYFAGYQATFPVDDSVEPSEYLHNRELYRFLVRWALEEDAHAHVLFLYQVKTGIASAEKLRLDLREEGARRFDLGCFSPVQACAYTLIQEKATQLFYRSFAASLNEPLLRRILMHLARDEARHFAFFAAMMEEYVGCFGQAVLAPVKEVLAGFRMPLSSTMARYWRRSLEIADAVGGYDHTEAYEALVASVQRAADGATRSVVQELTDLVRALRGL
jgi:acyl-[acyl-carrier protein] desaturase